MHCEILAKSRVCPVPHAEMYLIALQIFLGLAYVHGKNMIHRDIAARNIMLKTGPGGAIVYSSAGGPRHGPGGGSGRLL